MLGCYQHQMCTGRASLAGPATDPERDQASGSLSVLCQMRFESLTDGASRCHERVVARKRSGGSAAAASVSFTSSAEMVLASYSRLWRGDPRMVTLDVSRFLFLQPE